MHEVVSKSILNNSNKMNIYRGCTHGCIYCDSRSECYQMEHDFDDVEIKINALELLEDNLKKKRKRCMIHTGYMSDPYNEYERDYEYTRKALEIIYRYGFGVTILTKSNLILRDLDLIYKINKRNKAVVQMTITTMNDNLCKIIEPRVQTTSQRFEVLNKCKELNIDTIVWLSPILPFINDTKENIIEIIDMCHKSGVKGIICFNMGLTLRNGNREYFYENLDIYFKGLKEKYMRYYGKDYEVKSPHNDELMKIFHEECAKRNIMHNIMEIFTFLKANDNALMNEISIF